MTGPPPSQYNMALMNPCRRRRAQRPPLPTIRNRPRARTGASPRPRRVVGVLLLVVSLATGGPGPASAAGETAAGGDPISLREAVTTILQETTRETTAPGGPQPELKPTATPAEPPRGAPHGPPPPKPTGVSTVKPTGAPPAKPAPPAPTKEGGTSDPVTDLCQRIGTKLASIGPEDCIARKLLPSGAVSVEGTPILVREYPPLPGREPQARVLLLGGIHGDEYSSISIVFRWMEALDRFHSGLFYWHVAPLVNPDGLLREQSQRQNAHGVDLNRNFPTNDWFRESEDYWVRRTSRDPRRFPGFAPLSEPESVWVAHEIEHFRPHVIVSVHAPYGVLDFDGPRTVPPKQLGSLFLSMLGTYPGSLGRWVGVENDLPIITIELPNAGIMPSDLEVRTIWMDLVTWIRSHIFSPESGKKSPPLPGKNIGLRLLKSP
nr:Peptidase M14, carboxypeptidase A precursor [uncultured bacterium]